MAETIEVSENVALLPITNKTKIITALIIATKNHDPNAAPFPPAIFPARTAANIGVIIYPTNKIKTGRNKLPIIEMIWGFTINSNIPPHV